MTLPKLIFSLGLLLCIAVGSCKKQDLTSECTDGAYVKKVESAEGRIYFDAARKQYTLRVLNSFDSHDVGYVCSMPSAFQKEGLVVKFSGRYFEYDKPAQGVAGDKFYYLSVDEIAAK
ncbi:hypothetical protein [Runella sp.]|uniref:hypothetical protein n=1 Tax=Runella sp. TaxID=1960881 RepID=UPI003D0FA769